MQLNINYTVHNIKGLVNKGIRFQNYDESTQKRVCQSGVFKLDVKTKSEYGYNIIVKYDSNKIYYNNAHIRLPEIDKMFLGDSTSIHRMPDD